MPAACAVDSDGPTEPFVNWGGLGPPGERAIRVRAVRQNSPNTRFRLSSQLSERLSSGEYAAYR